MEYATVTDYTNGNSENSKVKVFVRVRPNEDGSKLTPDMFPKVGEEQIFQFRKPEQYGAEHMFQYDGIFWDDSQQDQIFDPICIPMVEQVLNGFNCCCFAYGQTGSGKTYSIFGECGEKRGLIPRTLDYLFKSLGSTGKQDIGLSVSFLEMYCDQIRDLGIAYIYANDRLHKPLENTADWFHTLQQQKFGTGSPDSPKERIDSSNLELREDDEGKVFTKGLTVIPVNNTTEVMNILQIGFKLRATQETKMNATSSRSHTVFTVIVTSKDPITGLTQEGKMNFVDLAGSERVKKSEATGMRLKEALNINKSLSALGKVVMALDNKGAHIPYRDSKLTRLLQNSLGGNSFTVLLATVRPDPEHYEEGLSTLQFANRVRNVNNQPRINTITKNEDEMKIKIKQLGIEITNLKTLLANMKDEGNKRFERILAELGIKGHFLPDGRFQCDDGRILGYRYGEGGDGESGSEINQEGIALASKEVIKELNKSREENNYLQTKLNEVTEELNELKIKYMKEMDEMRNKLSEANQKIFGLEKKIIAKEKEKEILLNDRTRQCINDMKEVMSHSTDIINDRENQLNKMIEKLHIDSDYIKKLKELEKSMKNGEKLTMNKEMEALVMNYENKISHLKEQFAYWLKVRDDQLQKFIDDFNKFYHYKNDQILGYRKELLMLYEHCNILSSLVERMENGKIPLTRNTNVRSFKISPSDRPDELLNDPKRLHYLSNQLKRCRNLWKTNGRGYDIPENNKPDSSRASINSNNSNTSSIKRETSVEEIPLVGNTTPNKGYTFQTTKLINRERPRSAQPLSSSRGMNNDYNGVDFTSKMRYDRRRIDLSLMKSNC